jgi:hypothetical protein
VKFDFLAKTQTVSKRRTPTAHPIMNSYQSDQWLSSSLFTQQPTESMDMSANCISHVTNENKIDDLEQLTLHWMPNAPVVDRRRNSFTALLSDILPNHNHNHTNHHHQQQTCNSLSTPFESLGEMESSLTTAPDSDELARAELMLHQMSGFNTTKQPNKTRRRTPSPSTGVRTGSPAGKKPASSHKRTNSGGAAAVARKIKKEQLHRHTAGSPTSAALLPQLHTAEPKPTTQRRPAASDPINAFLPADKAEILHKDHKPARGRGRTAQLQQMTQEQIEAEADARVEKNRQAARECWAKRNSIFSHVSECLSPKMCEIRAPSLYFFLRLVSQVLPLW